MCKLIVPGMVSAVSLSESLFVVRPENLLVDANSPCAGVIVPNVRHLWYASWMNGLKFIHVWSAMGLQSQSLRSCWYNPQRAMRSSALIRSCWVVYGFLARVAISWTSVHLLNRISAGGSCGLYGAKNVMLFWRMASGVGLPYVVVSWLKMPRWTLSSSFLLLVELLAVQL